MKKVNITEIVREIAQDTNQPETLVSDLYSAVVADMNRDARFMDFIPLLAARRVRENLREISSSARETGSIGVVENAANA